MYVYLADYCLFSLCLLGMMILLVHYIHSHTIHLDADTLYGDPPGAVTSRMTFLETWILNEFWKIIPNYSYC